MTIDYGQTIHLPKTDFPRRAGLAQKEPELNARWEKIGLYDLQRKASAGREKFILHMGPPFANGHIHIGHVLSTVLKDVVCRSYQMMGYDAPLVPGFDCHGLPIEWKVEEDFRSAGKNGNKDTDPIGFRTACRDFAQKWVGVQSSEFQRIGVLGDWKDPYVTMAKKSEAMIAREIHKFLQNGSLYRGSKPVMWSIPEQTALAEAEVEYKDITSDTCFVKFPVKTLSPALSLALSRAAGEGSASKAGAGEGGLSVAIWTTTPWTLPGNRAIGFGEDIEYQIVEVESVHEGSLLSVGNKFIISAARMGSFAVAAKVNLAEVLWSGKGTDLEGIICHHPLHGQGYDFDVPLLPGDFVTAEDGTGFVHIAPGHGEDDYQLGLKNKIEVPHTVGPDGKYFDHVSLFAGLSVYMPDGKKGPANKLVMEAIHAAGNLVAKDRIQHSYPHSWRSKAPVIFRNTPQWFISMEKNDLRKKALAEISKTRFVPPRGQNRIGAMVEGRGDWCVSRQRAWGVPIAIFVDKKTGEALRDEKVLACIYDIFEKEGSDAWFNRPAQDFLGPDHRADDFDQVKDIIDVWFESGSTQGFVLEDRAELTRPADLYLEGSDQHRGWFQSSLLVGCGTRGNAPYKAVLTHGFILDEKGYKMSKSEGNVTSPMKLSENYGADILRLWVTGSDYTADIKFGESILKGHVDIYRRIRGTFCYLLGSLGDFEKADDKDLSDLDKWVLHKLHAIDAEVRQNIRDFDFQAMVTTVHNFCARELSAFYFDVCKDTLYCDTLDAPRRRAVLTILDHVFNFLVHWLSPVLCFTAEEAWLSYKGLSLDDAKESIHLSRFPEAPAHWKNDALDAKWKKILAVRSVVTGALEVKRAEKVIGASLEAAVSVYADEAAVAGIDLAGICIVSKAVLAQGVAPAHAFTLADVPGIAVTVEKAPGQKCERCWTYTQDTGAVPAHATLCKRCGEAVVKQLKSQVA